MQIILYVERKSVFHKEAMQYIIATRYTYNPVIGTGIMPDAITAAFYN